MYGICTAMYTVCVWKYVETSLHIYQNRLTRTPLDVSKSLCWNDSWKFMPIKCIAWLQIYGMPHICTYVHYFYYDTMCVWCAWTNVILLERCNKNISVKSFKAAARFKTILILSLFFRRFVELIRIRYFFLHSVFFVTLQPSRYSHKFIRFGFFLLFEILCPTLWYSILYHFRNEICVSVLEAAFFFLLK